MAKATTAKEVEIAKTVQEILASLEKDRERRIIAGRFGLNGRKETLEEIGQELGITRERVRQIEKQLSGRLTNIKHPRLDDLRTVLRQYLEELGRVAPVHEVADKFGLNDEQGFAQVSFLAHLFPDFVVIPADDQLKPSIAIKEHHDSKRLHQLAAEFIDTLKRLGRPAKLDEVAVAMPTRLETHHLHGLARSSRQATVLEGEWGLVTNPLVNPKSIRDKIYVVLAKNGKPMHFTDIAGAIKQSNFRRRDVTTQAIHNELIKDERFVLVGRGIYALREWGYEKGTVSDVIAAILAKESPLHRDEIVRRVLKERQVKPTTVILNLQGKKQFKRVAKATYALVEN